MDTKSWVPKDTPLDRPSPARIYDHLLGGYHNFEIDRQVAEQFLKLYPEARTGALANRAFLRRVVGFIAEQGIGQFLDLGSGIPTVGNVHEIAQAVNPTARIIYVDIDPIAVAHSLVILENNPDASAIQADICQPDVILSHPEIKRLLDWSKPAAILFLTVLHYIADDDLAYNTVRTLCDKLVPGSYIAISHNTYDGVLPEAREGYEKVRIASRTSTAVRTHAQILKFFEGFELVEPGLVHTPYWRPEGPDDVLLDRPGWAIDFAGVGRKL